MKNLNNEASKDDLKRLIVILKNNSTDSNPVKQESKTKKQPQIQNVKETSSMRIEEEKMSEEVRAESPTKYFHSRNLK